MKQPKELHNKKDHFNPRMVPHILVGIGIGPGGVWDKTYLVVKLEKMLGDNRRSRVNIRKSPNVMFLDKPTFPLKAKLTASGYLGDVNLPGPAVSDTSETFGLQNNGKESESEKVDNEVDGALGENRPALIDT